MTRSIVCVLASIMAFALITSACTSRQPETIATLPHEDSPLPFDAAPTWGKMPNGMVYAVMANNEPRDRVSLRLLVMSGSLQESDEQRGLAHYLEHMAFTGSAHFPPGTLIEHLQRLGLGFGNDTNAHTSFDETVYKLDLPDAKPETITTGLTVMADFAGGLLIPSELVERERGVILAEMRDRDSPALRAWKALSLARYPGLIIPARLPIGVHGTVSQATPALLRAFYDTWYRPERMAISVVGAIDVAQVATEVRARFTPLLARGPRQNEPEFGELKASALNFSYHRESEADGTQVQISRTISDPQPLDTPASRRVELACDLAESVLSRRFQDLVAAAPDGPIIGAEVSGSRWLGLWHADLSAQVRPGKALTAIPILEQELRRFVRFGPTATEMDAIRADMLAQLDAAVARAASRANRDLATGLVGSVKLRRVFQSPAQARELLAPMIKAISGEEARASFAPRWNQGHQLVMVTGTEDLGTKATSAISTAWNDSLAVAVKAPVSKAVGLWAYGRDWQPIEETPPSIKEVTSDLDRSVGTQRWQIGNVVVLVKSTDFKPDEILVRLRLDCPPGPRQAGLAELAGAAFLAGGLGKHSVQDLRDIFAGSTVSLTGPLIDDDGVVFAARCRPQELESCLQRLRAFLSDPGWRSEAEVTVKAGWLEQLATLDTDLDQRVSRAFQDHVVGGVAERRSATLAEASAVGFAQVKTWLEPLLRTAPLTVTVVGDLKPDEVRDLVARYVALPLRSAIIRAESATEVSLAKPAEWRPAKLDLDVPGTVARARLIIAWPTEDFYDVARTRRLSLLSQAFTEMLRQRIRDKLGEAYSPRALHQASEAYRGFGCLIAEVGVAPDKAEEVRAVVLAIACEMAEKGIDEPLLAQIRPPLLNSLATMRRQNGYWADRVLTQGAAQPFRLAWSTTIEDDYKAITAAEISDLAKRYLVNERAVQVLGVCKGRGGDK